MKLWCIHGVFMVYCTALYVAKGGGVGEGCLKPASAMKDQEPEVWDETARFASVLPRGEVLCQSVAVVQP